MDSAAGNPRVTEVCDSLEGWIRAWADADDVEARRELEARIFGSLSAHLARSLRSCFGGSEASLGVDVVEDVLQDTCCELPRILATFLDSVERKGGGDFRAYLSRVVRNNAEGMASDRRREREVWRRMAESRPSRLGRAPTTPSRAEMRNEHRELLDRELAALEPLDQTILRLCAEDLSLAAIGRELSIPATTVQYRYDKCRTYLMRRLGRALGGDPREE